VLGQPAREHADHDRLTRLRGRYEALYIAAWTDFLAGLRVRRPADLDAAADLLSELTADDRPLTRIFTALEHHTRGLARPQTDSLTHLLQASDHPDRSAAIVRAFAPLLTFAITTPERQSSLDRYHARLGELQLALDAARRDPAELPALQTTLGTALADTHALLQPPELRRFRPLLQALLLPPLDALQSALRDHDKLALTSAYCAEIDAPLRKLVARYPFTRNAHDELSLPEFTAFFHPTTGALRRFRDAHLAPLLEIHGPTISPKPTPRADAHPLAPAVLALLTRAAELGDLAFPDDKLGLDLELDLHCNADIGRVTFTLDGATHTYACGPDHHARMQWPGDDQNPAAPPSSSSVATAAANASPAPAPGASSACSRRTWSSPPPTATTPASPSASTSAPAASAPSTYPSPLLASTAPPSSSAPPHAPSPSSPPSATPRSPPHPRPSSSASPPAPTWARVESMIGVLNFHRREPI
jgi:type VI protein secretion system component VasK